MKKRITSFLLALVLCFSLISTAPAQAYKGTEAMSTGDADVVEAVMLNLIDYAERITADQTIIFGIDNPLVLFVDSKIEEKLAEVPECGETLVGLYRATKLAIEASWELGEAISLLVGERRNQMETALTLSVRSQASLINCATTAYQLGVKHYADGIWQPPELGYDLKAQTAEIVQLIRDQADDFFWKKNREAVIAAADTLEALASYLADMEVVYQAGYNVAASRARTLTAEEYVKARIDLLYSKLNGKYFTTTGKTCGNDSCDKCNVVNIVEAEHLKNLLDGFVPSASIMKKVAHNYGKGNPFTAGSSCCGFANFAAWYIFAENTTDYMKFNCICPNGKPVDFTEENLREMGIKPGDVLRLSNHPTLGNSSEYKRHSVIFVDFTENGIMVLDSNFKLNGDGSNCVRKHELQYSAYKYVCVSRAENYDEKGGSVQESTENTKTQYRYHIYVNENGKRYICPYYGQDAYPGTTFTIRYTEWLDEPLPVDNGGYNYFSHPKHEKCDKYGCIDDTYNGDRYRDADGLIWYYQETRQVPDEKVDPTPEITENTKTQYRYHIYVNENGKRYICPYYGQDAYPGTTFIIRYTEWLDEPLPVDNGNYNYFSHPKHEKCDQYGCIDDTYNGDRYKDANGLTWYYQETRQVTDTSSVKVNFTDVQTGAYYESPVRWAVATGITNGTSDSAFSPDNLCTRAQIITFLWRAVGSPKATTNNPFTDVKIGDYYYDAAIWAYQKGMVSGSVFGGNTSCTRAYTVIYLWKNAGAPATRVTNVFSDVRADSEYAQAVAWALANGVTAGTSNTTFSPDSTCTRGQIVTFLYRCIGK